MLLRLSIVVLRSWPSQQVFATKFGKNKAFARKTAACENHNTFAIATACTANTGYVELVLYKVDHSPEATRGYLSLDMRAQSPLFRLISFPYIRYILIDEIIMQLVIIFLTSF